MVMVLYEVSFKGCLVLLSGGCLIFLVVFYVLI